MKTRAAILFCAALGLAACTSTVVPNRVDAAQPSYDGNLQTSGILAVVPGGRLVTPHLRDRYNALVAKYGRDYLVPLRPNEGFSPAPDGVNLIVDLGHYEKFLEMNQWNRAGIKPMNP